MMIIIKNIPSHVQIHELENVINPLIKGQYWQKSGILKSLKMIEVSDAQKTFAEYHYIGVVTPEKVGKRVIKNLNGKNAFGVSLVAQKYIVRNWREDPRLNNENPNEERRIIDRRRPGLTLKRVVHK